MNCNQSSPLVLDKYGWFSRIKWEIDGEDSIVLNKMSSTEVINVVREPRISKEKRAEIKRLLSQKRSDSFRQRCFDEQEQEPIVRSVPLKRPAPQAPQAIQAPTVAKQTIRMNQGIPQSSQFMAPITDSSTIVICNGIGFTSLEDAWAYLGRNE